MEREPYLVICRAQEQESSDHECFHQYGVRALPCDLQSTGAGVFRPGVFPPAWSESLHVHTLTVTEVRGELPLLSTLSSLDIAGAGTGVLIPDSLAMAGGGAAHTATLLHLCHLQPGLLTQPIPVGHTQADVPANTSITHEQGCVAPTFG